MSYNVSDKLSKSELALQMYKFLENTSNDIENLQPSDIDSGIKTNQINSIFNQTFTQFEYNTIKINDEKSRHFSEFSQKFNISADVTEYILNYFKIISCNALLKLSDSLFNHVLNLKNNLRDSKNKITGFEKRAPIPNHKSKHPHSLLSTNWTLPAYEKLIPKKLDFDKEVPMDED